MVLAASGFAFVVLVGCYRPNLEHCTVACTEASGCPGDLTCVGGYCLGPGEDPCGGLSGALSISAGDRYACMVDVDGRLFCWGSGGYGQLGTGGDSSVAVQVGSDTVWTSVDAGWNHTCGLREGQVWCWGADNDGECGRGDFVGNRSPGEVTDVGVSDWSQVSAGHGHTCAISGDRGLYCWGANDYGQVGQPIGEPVRIPTRVGANADWNSISVGGYHACGIRDGGRLFCFGGDVEQQLGNGADTTAMSVPVEVAHPEGGSWAVVGAGELFTCALDGDGVLWCWGAADQVESSEDVASPERVGTGEPFDELYVGLEASCAVRSGEAWCWGDNQGLQLLMRDQPRVPSPTRLSDAGGIVGMAIGYQHTCAVFTDRPVSCWGQNGVGELGIGEVANKTAPAAIAPGMRWIDVAPGGSHTCALAMSGEIYCWGWNDSGQLGTGDQMESATPVKIGDSSSWTSISTGAFHSCAVAAGDAWCWGWDDLDQLGNGGRGPESRPFKVTNGAGLDAITLGYVHSLALGTGGARWGWGANAGLGVPGLATPTPTEYTNGVASFTAIDGGLYFSCGIEAAQGQMWCWGENNRGQTGQAPSATPIDMPVQVMSDIGWTDVSAGYDTACGVRAGALYCWGSGGAGQLGNGGGADSMVPVQVTHTKAWSSVSTGERNTCGLDVDGDVYCWGDGFWGQNGNGIENSDMPTIPVASGPYRMVRQTFTHVCAIRLDDDSLWCWGRNNRWQLGDGTGPSLVPVPVVFPP